VLLLLLLLLLLLVLPGLFLLPWLSCHSLSEHATVMLTAARRLWKKGVVPFGLAAQMTQLARSKTRFPPSKQQPVFSGALLLLPRGGTGGGDVVRFLPFPRLITSNFYTTPLCFDG
jgi:hypothetical protein